MMRRTEAIQQLTAPGARYELEDVEMYGRTCRWFRHAPTTLRDLFDQARSDAEFFVYDDERLTYEDAWQQASRIGRLLIDKFDVQPGDRVAVSMRNYPEWVLAYMAATSIGAVIVGLNSLWQPEEMQYGLIDSGTKVLFADQERLDMFAKCTELPAGLQVLGVRCEGIPTPNTQLLADALSAIGSSEMPDVALDPDADATIFYTSGSTGHPKGVVSCHRAIVAALMSWELDIHAAYLMLGTEPPVPESQRVALVGVPLFHVTGTNAIFLHAFREQRRLISMYRWDVAQAAELIERERVDRFIAPAAMTGDLVEYARTSDRDLSSLAVVGGGGAPRAPEQVRNIDKSFGEALPNTGWGMTETNAIGAGIAGADYLERPESSGRCSAVLELRIVDEFGSVMSTGERGELLVRGTSMCREYWHRPDANAETFVDGWMRTGDVAYLDDEGFLFIVDRLKDLVIRGGENIGCGTVEAAILEHPAVLEVSVYGVPDERLGEEVGATIHTSGDLTPEELREFLAPHLARFEIPRHIHISSEPLPRTGSGKILKRDLRAEAATRVEALRAK
jgi:long-chain acyl-CoA synthetase